MRAHKEGSHIVTTTSTDGVLLGTAGIYAVSKMAVSGLMEQLRHDLRTTNIGTSNLVPGMTTTNLGRSESEYRPEALKNDPPPAGAQAGPPRPAGARPPQRPVPPETHADVGAPAGPRSRLVAWWSTASSTTTCGSTRRRSIVVGRAGPRRCDGGIDGGVLADAGAHRGRQGPLLPHADLRAGDRTPARDDEAQHSGI